MKIGIFLNPHGANGGLERYVHETALALIRANTQNQYVIYAAPESDLSELKSENCTIVIHSFDSIAWRIFGNRSVDSDVYIFFTPIIPPLFRGRIVSVFFDAAFLYETNRNLAAIFKKFFHRFLHSFGMHRSEKVVTISQASKNDAVRLLRVPEDKINVVYCGFNQLEKPHRSSEVLVKGEYFLYVGPYKSRKNVDRIIRAYAQLIEQHHTPVSLVLAGRFDEASKQRIAEKHGNVVFQKLTFFDRPSDQQLAILYEHATCLVFPSLVEGFGLPVLEAMSLGCPVITSNCSSLPEVAGDAAVLVNPQSVTEIQLAMKRLLFSREDRAELKKAGLLRSTEFSWQKSAEQWTSLLNAL